MDAYPLTALLGLVGLGALVGASGGLLRALAEVVRLNAAANSAAKTGQFSGRETLLSTAIGAIVGAIAAASFLKPGGKPVAEEIAGLLVAGYAGADLVDVFITRAAFLPSAPTIDGSAAMTELEWEDPASLGRRLFESGARIVRARGLHFAPEAEADVRRIADQAASRVYILPQPEREHGEVMAERAFAILINAMIMARSEVYSNADLQQNFLGEQTLAAARNLICPLWPIC